MSPDGKFLARPVPDVPGLWVASGCNGSGFSSSPALGEALAEWITAGQPPDGLAALAPSRFGRGCLIRCWSSEVAGSTRTTTTR